MRLGVSAAPGLLEGGRALATRLAWISGLRLGFLTLLLALIAFLYLRGNLAEYSESIRIVFGTIGAAYAMAALYTALLRRGRRLTLLAYAQLALDQITWTAIVYVSGGATSGATSFYPLTCLVGAILIGQRGAALAALIGALIYTTLCAAFWLGWLHPPADQAVANYALTLNTLLFPWLVNLLGIVVVSLLAGYLAERLRATGGALEEATQRALEAERLATLGRVAAGLAHEIRNPLGSIRGSIEMLREVPGLSGEDRQLCELVEREVARLNHLVTDMMDLARPRPPKPEFVDVAELAREVVELAKRSERSGSGDVSVRYEGPADAALARCDGAQMRQVLWNLVRNGVQASAAGSEVVVLVKPRPGGVLLAVEDEGPGIPEESRARIFDAFYTTRSHGAGMGLAVVKRIMDDHAPYGATIEVVSAPKGGASFRIFLPED